MKLLVISPPHQPACPFTELLRLSRVRLVQSGHGHSTVYSPDSPEQRIHQLHATLLLDMQKAWFQRISREKLRTDDDTLNTRLEETVGMLDRHEAWAIQDPLLAYFLPAWLEKVEDAVVILHYSEPLECAITLKKEWRFPVSFGLALWEQYVLEAVRTLQGRDCLLLSSRKLRQQPEATLTSLIARFDGESLGLALDGKPDWSATSDTPPDELESHADFLRDSQKILYRHLETGALGRIVDCKLSPESEDILEGYGHIRSGYDSMRKGRDEALECARKALAVSEKQKADSTAGRSVADESRESPTGLCEVTVHIKGLQPVEFVTEPDSPVLNMLQQAMQAGNRSLDRLLYIDLQDEDVSALYFMASDLTGVDTLPDRPAAA